METGSWLNEGEKVLIERSPRNSLVYYLTFKYSWAVALGVLIINSVMYFSTSSGANMTAVDISFAASNHEFIIAAMKILLIYVGLVYLLNLINVPQFRYVFTDKSVIINSGVVRVNKRVIPYNTITGVDIRQGTIEVLLGLSSVYIDEEAKDFRKGTWIRGLGGNDVENISEIISQYII
jgi:membrane protein YdbS with pleckstrin-like domain